MSMPRPSLLLSRSRRVKCEAWARFRTARSRFDGARQLMGYCGAVPSEDSSGKRTRRGSITKTGNAHLRRIVVEAAWSYHRPPCIWYGEEICEAIGDQEVRICIP